MGILSLVILCQELESEGTGARGMPCPAQIRADASLPPPLSHVFRSVASAAFLPAEPQLLPWRVSLSATVSILQNSKARVNGTALRVTIVTNEPFSLCREKRHWAAVLEGKDPSFPHADTQAVLNPPQTRQSSGTQRAVWCLSPAYAHAHTPTCTHTCTHTRVLLSYMCGTLHCVSMGSPA